MPPPSKKAKGEVADPEPAEDEVASESGSDEGDGSGTMEEHVHQAIRTMRLYRAYARRVGERHLAHARKLPEAYFRLVPLEEFGRQAASLLACADANADFIEAVATHTVTSWWPKHLETPYEEDTRGGGDDEIKPDDEVQLKELDDTVTSVVREWSAVGAPSRASCFDPLVASLDKHLDGVGASNVFAQRVLVPGAGLGRLGVAAAARGFAVEVNEVDLLQVLVADFIVCEGDKDEPWTIHPFFADACNQKTFESRVRAVAFPDVTPAEELARAALAHGGGEGGGEELAPLVTAFGDFCGLYGGDKGGESDDDGCGGDGDSDGDEEEAPQLFDAVCSAFFVDTSPVVFDYLVAIKQVLRKGGVWANLGPLGWHYAHRDADEDADGDDAEFAAAIELPWSTLRSAIEAAGFEILAEEFRPGCNYKSDPASMQQTSFETVFFVARRT